MSDAQTYWDAEEWRSRRIREIADRLDSPYADKVYIAKEYTKADLRRDLLATIPKRLTQTDNQDQEE
jgi:hypothetical protein